MNGKEGERTAEKGQELRRGKLRTGKGPMGKSGARSLHVHERLCLKCLYSVLLSCSTLVNSLVVYFITLSLMQALQHRMSM